MGNKVTYSREAWWEECFMKLVNEQHFTKLKFTKLNASICSLANSKFTKLFCRQNRITVNLPKCPLTTVSCYVVYKNTALIGR